MESDINILIPDGNSTWTIPVINCLSTHKNMNIYVLSDKKRTAAKFSRFTKYYRYYKRISDNQRLNVINDEIKKNNISVILPIAENEINFLINFSNQISKSAKVVPLPSAKSFNIATNKWNLNLFCEQHNIPYPKSRKINGNTNMEDIKDSLKFPVLLKPFDEKGGNGIVKFDSNLKLKTYLSENTQSNNFLIQEFIDGFDIDCSVFCVEGKILYYTIQKGNLTGDNQFAPQLGFDFLYEERVYIIIKKLMKDLKWNGVAHVDLRYDENSDDFKIIEINARFWGSLEASKAAGVNFPYLAINYALGNIIVKDGYKKISFMRFKGFLKSIIRNPILLLKTKYILNNNEVKSVINDPLPKLYNFKKWLSRQFF